MPQTVDRIDFAYIDVDPSQWPKLSCGGSNLLQLEAGSLQLEAGRTLTFADNGQVRSFDDTHRLVFNRTGNLLELHEAGDIRFLTGAPTPTEKLRIRADGNVGIGTDTPGAMLHVVGDLRSDGSLSVQRAATVNGPLTVTGATNLGADTQVQGNLQASGFIDAPDLRRNGVSLTSSQWANVAGGINYAGGNVGIGTETPGKALDVAGQGFFRSAPWRGPLVNVAGTVIGFDAANAGGTGFIFAHAATGQTTRLWLDGNPLIFAPLGTERMRITDAGNVGIGTTSPQGMLDVQGDIRAGNSDLYFTKVDHHHTGIGNTVGWAAIENAVSHDALMILGRAGTARGRAVKLWDYLQVNGDLDVMGRINGQLGGLDVAPTFQARVRCADFVIGGVGDRGPERRALVAWANALEINHNGDWPAVIIHNVGNGSSRERKANIAQLTLAAAHEALHTLNPVEYTVKTDPEQKIRSGFIAEESPNLVATSDHKAIFVDGIVAVLTKIVQQQDVEIAALKADIKALAGFQPIFENK